MMTVKDLMTSECQSSLAQRTRVGLTDEQWQIIADTLGCFITRGQKDIIEAALGIKENTAEEMELTLLEICLKCRSNEWGPNTPRKEILNWMHNKAVQALTSEAIEQPAQQEAKIVRWNCPCGNKYTFHGFTEAPPQRTWVGLTESEITTSLPYSVTRDKGCFHAGALWAEAKLKEKNCG